MLARSGVQASDSHIVARYVAQLDLEAAQAVVVGRDAHTVEGYRGDAAEQSKETNIGRCGR